jgi:hypothetical protein
MISKMLKRTIPTTKSVTDRFTAEYQRVADAQQTEADAAETAINALQTKINKEVDRKLAAANEVTIAKRAITGIQELLGVETD